MKLWMQPSQVHAHFPSLSLQQAEPILKVNNFLIFGFLSEF